MFTKSELLGITGVPERLFDYSICSGLIPHPERIVWLNPVSQAECFPNYVLNDLFRLSYLEGCGISALWELKEFLLGGQGLIRYEGDIKKISGDIFYGEVESNQKEVGDKLRQKAEASFRSEKIVSATFRAENVSGRAFLVLSRVVLRPKKRLFQVEIKQSTSKDDQRRMTEAYKLIMRRRLL